MLNPLSTVFCRHPNRKSDPTLVPLIFNNTTPAKVTYTVTTFDDPPRSHTLTVPASSLVRRAHPALHRRDGTSTSDEDDELALASEWALVPSNPSSQQVLRHTLPDEPSTRDKSDPFGLSPSESLYFLPVSTIGSIRLDSITDTEGHPIRIRRKRSATVPNANAGAEAGALVRAFEETRILRCPTAGFSLDANVLGYAGQEEEHRCLAPNQGVPESWPLGLVVSGTEPMSIRWYSREGDKLRGARKEGELAGIVGGSSGSPSSALTVSDAVVPVPLNASLSRPGRTTYYIESVKDAAGNTVSYSGDSKAPLVEGTVLSRSVMVHRPPEVAFIGDCARGEEVHLLRDKTRNKSRKLQLKLSGIDEELHDARSSRGHAAQFHVDVKFVPEHAHDRGWTRTIEATSARAELDVDLPGTYEIVDVNSEFCAGAVLVPNSCTVVVQPVPTLETSFTPINDVCNAETGMIASLHLTGAPPFAVHYTVTRLSGPGAPRTMHHTHRVSHSRDEIRFQPGPGEWEYRFNSVDDAFYRNLPLEDNAAALVRRQSVPVVGDAKWRNADQGKTVHSCEGETVQVEVELQVCFLFAFFCTFNRDLPSLTFLFIGPGRASRRGRLNTRSSVSAQERFRTSPSRRMPLTSKSRPRLPSTAVNSRYRSVRRSSSPHLCLRTSPDQTRFRQRASGTGTAAAGRSPPTISSSRYGVRNRRRASTALKGLGPCSSATASLQRSRCVSAESA